MKTCIAARELGFPDLSAPRTPLAVGKRRFEIERLEERIAPQGSLLDLNVNVTLQNINITLKDINVIVAGNVIQLGILSGPITGTANSSVTVGT